MICADPERTLHIDSKVLEIAEAQDERSPSALTGGRRGRRGRRGRAGRPKLTKEEQAESSGVQSRYRGTARQAGGADPERDLGRACFPEGWDARTVTHVMGLRAFSSQLLCEQVVGRGPSPGVVRGG